MEATLSIKVKSPEEIITLATETQENVKLMGGVISEGTNYLVGGVWYTPELKDIILSKNEVINVTIPNEKSGNLNIEDYYIFPINRDEYAIPKIFISK